MWKMIKAELSYVRYARIVLIIPACIVLTILIYKNTNAINLTMYMSSLILTANMLGIRSKEKRSHREVLLPLKQQSVSKARALLIILPVLTFLLIGIFVQLVYSGYKDSWYDSIYELMMMSGVVILLENLYLYNSDSYSIASKSSKVIFNSIVLTLLLIAMVIIAVSIRNIFNSSFIFGVVSIILLILAGFILSTATVRSYEKREIFID